MNILIAEDDITSRALLAALLNRWGFEALPACDGVEAWDILQRADAPKLVLLDWNMPGMNGLDVVRRVRALDQSEAPYIVLLTAMDAKRNIVEGLDAGANDFIAKPYDSDELLARIRVGQRMIEMQTQLHAVKNALAHEAMHDPLTGLFNRRAILERLRGELSRERREHGPLCVGLCDIDHFKQVNDRHGHQAGDEALCGFANTAQSILRPYDFVGRYGGEEFLIVAPGASGAPRQSPFERLRATVAAAPIATQQGPIAITVSIGVVGAGENGTVDGMLESADAALYRAKREGRNRVAYASETNHGDAAA